MVDKSDYYADQMELLMGDPETVIVKFEDDKSSTKWMSLNKDACNTIISWLITHKEYVE